MELIFSEERVPAKHITAKMEEAGIICVRDENLDPDRVQVSVTFVSSVEIKELNRIYRQNDAVTDVLSFPQYSDLQEIEEEGPICLGDVVICTEQALLQADDFGHSPERELVYLFVHSMYHLLGYDHMDDGDRDAMREKEEAVMETIGLTR